MRFPGKQSCSDKLDRWVEAIPGVFDHPPKNHHVKMDGGLKGKKNWFFPFLGLKVFFYPIKTNQTQLARPISENT